VLNEPETLAKEASTRSPDGAQRNPGLQVTMETMISDYASLHPGYEIL
jgi:hypothetical protein